MQVASIVSSARFVLLPLFFVFLMAGVVQHCKASKPWPPVLLNPLNVRSRLAAGQAENKAQKFDEFGDLAYSDMIARLDNYAVELMNQPDTKGFIIVYRTRRDLHGYSHRRAMRMKEYLVQTRGLPRERVIAVDGGAAENLIQELWIIPSGSAPVPRSDARIGDLSDPDTAWKYDESLFLPLEQYRRFGVTRDREAEVELLEAYANEVKKKPDRSGCIIVYAQYNPRPPLFDWSNQHEPHREARLDPPGTARRRLQLDREYLTKVYGIPASRIKTIDGGYRKHRSIEYWIVPAGEPLPIPTPNAFPFARKRRK